MEKQTIAFFNQFAVMLTGYLWIKFHWGKNTLVSLYLACDDDIYNWRRNQSKDISLMPPPPKFGKRETIANFWLAKNWKIAEFTLERPGSKNPIISRITYKKVKETIFRNYFLNWRSHLFYATCWQIFIWTNKKSSKLRHCLSVTFSKCTKPLDQDKSGWISYKLPHVWR